MGSVAEPINRVAGSGSRSPDAQLVFLLQKDAAFYRNEITQSDQDHPSCRRDTQTLSPEGHAKHTRRNASVDTMQAHPYADRCAHRYKYVHAFPELIAIQKAPQPDYTHK